MKKLVLSSLFVAFSLVATCAMAATESYNTKVGGFTIDVPEGWKGQTIADGCSIQTPDGSNALVVQFFPANDMSAMDAAKKMADLAKVKVNSQTDEGNAVFLDCDKDGTPWGILMVKTNGALMAAQLVGKDRDTMKKIYDTIKGK